MAVRPDIAITRRAALGGALAASIVPARARARLAYDLRPRQVASGLWMVEGAPEYFSMENGGAIVNVVMLETDAGMIVVDTGPSLRYGEALRQTALQTTGRGVAAVILTHHHPDHFLGNMAFDGIPIHALPETRALIGTNAEDYSDALYRLLGDWMRGTEIVPPTADVAASSITFGGRVLRLLPLGGHSEADLALIDVATGVVIAGDLAFLDRAPTTPDADLARWHGSLDTLEALEAAAIVPGHGPFDPAGASLSQTRAYLDWLDQTLRDAAEQGLDMVEIIDLPIPHRFAALGAQPQEFHRSVSHLYPDIETEILPLLNR